MQQKCRLSPAEQQDILAAFMHISEWVRISYLWRPNLRDEKDNHLIELAVAGNATYLVTHNIRDFQTMELRFPGLRVVRPTDITKED
ncbi:MAG: PIN domain-containing protein [Candidatus Sericytochromatia bacterium]|nr:PIN domain-containing protein [Candidatus Sericytochromatia bacterium]